MKLFKSLIPMLLCLCIFFTLQNCEKENIEENILENVEFSESSQSEEFTELTDLMNEWEEVRNSNSENGSRGDRECCEDVTIDVTFSPHNENCCKINIVINDPEGCTDGMFTIFFPKWNRTFTFSSGFNSWICPSWGEVVVSVVDCDISKTLSSEDCNKDECCLDDFVITQEEDTNNPGCCLVTVEDPCGDGFNIAVSGNNSSNILGGYGTHTFSLCEGETFNVYDVEFNEDETCDRQQTEEMGPECIVTTCCEDIDIIVTQTKISEFCCNLSVELFGCEDGWFYQFRSSPLGGVSNPYNLYPNSVVPLCNELGEVRFYNANCDFDSGWIGRDCL